MRHVVIGLGSGRCGTMSLAVLLESQDGVVCTHELGRPFPWNGSAWLVGHRLSHVITDAGENDIGGDIAYWYLPQVDHIHDFLDGEVRFVCLKREREACLKSMKNWNSWLGINPYQTHNASKWRRSIWDVTLPTFDFCTIESAMEKYYDGYYQLAEHFEEAYPGKFKIFDMDDLNTDDGVRGILDFVEVLNPKIITGIRKNTNDERLEKANRLNEAVPDGVT